ncbi:phenylalanine ammonia-lyase 1 [Striga asiatica]|uniref:Phenylalanine ammonia-lyase 1 n=1 Tax=Striga asiatica TaxID=4170 RepID=A0A5A7QAB9_STRAF|nr:phenylalanine ammonia-lyase 1 [Striga asiatica]
MTVHSNKNKKNNPNPNQNPKFQQPDPDQKKQNYSGSDCLSSFLSLSENDLHASTLKSIAAASATKTAASSAHVTCGAPTSTSGPPSLPTRRVTRRDIDAQLPAGFRVDCRAGERDCVDTASIRDEVETVTEARPVSPCLETAPGAPGGLAGSEDEPGAWAGAAHLVVDRDGPAFAFSCGPAGVKQLDDEVLGSDMADLRGKSRMFVRPFARTNAYVTKEYTLDDKEKRYSPGSQNPISRIPEPELAGENRLLHIPIHLKNLGAALRLPVKPENKSRVGIGPDVHLATSSAAKAEPAKPTAAAAPPADFHSQATEFARFFRQFLQFRPLQGEAGVNPALDGVAPRANKGDVGKLGGEALELEPTVIRQGTQVSSLGKPQGEVSDGNTHERARIHLAQIREENADGTLTER